MTKKKEESVMVMSDDLQKSLDSLQQFKSQTEIVKSNCEQIVISDPTTLAIAQQNLSKANDLLKYIEEKRIEIKAPYLVASKEIDRIGAELKQPVQDGIDHIKTQIKEWDAKNKCTLLFSQNTPSLSKHSPMYLCSSPPYLCSNLFHASITK